MEKTKSISLILGVLIMSIFIVYLVFAWTEPPYGGTCTNPPCPPGGNVPAPLNVSLNAQSKEGALVIGTNSGLTTGLIVQYGKVGIGTTAPGYKLDVDGDIRSRGKTYLGTAGFYAQYEYKTSGNVAAAGWYRVATMQGGDGRGQQQVTIYTEGGYYVPRSTTFRWHHDWGSGAGVSVISEFGSGYWSDVRVTDDGTNSFLEVYFTQAITGLGIGLQYIGGQDRGTIYSGDLLAGGDTVRVTTKANGLFALNDKFVVESAGNVAIGTTGPAYQLELSTDSAAKPGTNTWTVVSDARIKTDIRPFTDGLNTILGINPVLYKYNGKGGFIADGKDYIGVIAQDVQKVAPYTVNSYYDKLNPADATSIELLNFNSGDLTFTTINAIKELNNKIEALRLENEALKKRIEILETR